MNTRNVFHYYRSVAGVLKLSTIKYVRSLSVLMLFLLVPLSVMADVIRVYNWEAYLDDQVIEAFEQESGHQVIQLFYDEESVRDDVIASGRSQGYDLIMMDDSTLMFMADHGAFENISDTVDSIDGINPFWREACGDYGVAYGWGTLGILYRSSVAEESIKSWRQIFDVPIEHQGRLVAHLDFQDSIATALFALAKPPFSSDKEALKEVFNLLQKQQMYLLAQDYGLAYGIDHGAESKMSLSYGFSSDLYELRDATGQNDWVYTVPEDGTLLWVDCWAAPAGKPLKQAAKEFLVFINRPDIAAMNAESIGFATTNDSAIAIASDTYQSDKVLFPNESVLRKGKYYQILDPEITRLRKQIIHSLNKP